MAQPRHRDEHIDETAEEHHRQRLLPAESQEQHHRQRHERIEAHARREHIRHIGEQPHEKRTGHRGNNRREKHRAVGNPSLREQHRIDDDDIRHREKRRSPGDELPLQRAAHALHAEKPADLIHLTCPPFHSSEQWQRCGYCPPRRAKYTSPKAASCGPCKKERRLDPAGRRSPLNQMTETCLRRAPLLHELPERDIHWAAADHGVLAVSSSSPTLPIKPPQIFILLNRPIHPRSYITIFLEKNTRIPSIRQIQFSNHIVSYTEQSNI